MAGKKKDICLGCGKPFGRETAIQCAICGLWIHHKPCSGVSDEGFKFLDEQVKATGSAYWACRPCMAYSQGITQKIKVIEKDIEEVQKTAKANTEGVKKVEGSLEELKREVEKNKKEMEEAIRATERRMGAEWREREIRRKNVVMHRIAEAGESPRTGEERRQYDSNECNKILETMGLTNLAEQVKTCRRLGERGQEPRPLIVVLKTEEARRQILEKAPVLLESDYHMVGVVPDLTPAQRKEEEEMRTEAERLNREELTTEDVSKNLKWHVVGARGEKRLIKTADRGRGRGRGSSRGRWTQPEGGAGARTRGGGLLRTPPMRRNSAKRTRDQGGEEEETQEMETEMNPPKR